MSQKVRSYRCYLEFLCAFGFSQKYLEACVSLATARAVRNIIHRKTWETHVDNMHDELLDMHAMHSNPF